MVLLVFGVLLGTNPARAIDTGDITIVSLKGEVHVTMLGAERPVRVGSVLELPATLRTGRDGAVELRQGATSVDIGPDTLLEFPALAIAGGPIDRIVQPRGNAFYSVGKRPGRKLRVETPLLVGVVKGTQFNVAVQGDSTTISLFEGLLEIRAADESSVVDIKAGEIASRHSGDAGIGVLRMDAKAPPTRTPAGATNNPGGGDRPQPVAPRVSNTDDGARDIPFPQLSTELPTAAAPAVGTVVTAVSPPAAVEIPAVSAPAVVQVPAVSLPAVVESPAVSVPVVTTPVTEVAAVGVPATVATPVVTVPAVTVPAVDLGTSVAVSVGGTDLGASVDLGNSNSNAGPGNNNGNAGEGNNGNGKGNGGTGALNSGNSYDSLVDSVLNGTLKKPGKK